MNLKAQLRAYLAHKGLSAAELSRRTGVSRQCLSMWLGGASPKKIEHLKRVADELGTTIDHLCFGSGVVESLSVRSAGGPPVLSGVYELSLRRIALDGRQSNAP